MFCSSRACNGSSGWLASSFNVSLSDLCLKANAMLLLLSVKQLKYWNAKFSVPCDVKFNFRSFIQALFGHALAATYNCMLKHRTSKWCKIVLSLTCSLCNVVLKCLQIKVSCAVALRILYTIVPQVSLHFKACKDKVIHGPLWAFPLSL